MHNQRRKKNSAKTQTQASTTPKCPFKRPLHVNKDTEVVVEGAELPTNIFIVKKGDRLNPEEKVSVITSPFLNSSCANTRFRFAKGTPIHKKSFSGNKYTSVPSSRKTKVVSKTLGKINQRPKHIGHCSRVSDTLQRKTLTKIKNSKGDRYVQGSEDSGERRNFRYFEKSRNKRMSTSLKLVYDHPVFSEQKGWRQSSCDKL